MFLSSKNYLEQFGNLVKNSENLSLAVAFWGRGAETLIENVWTGKTLRILCNLGSGGTNPHVIRNILKLTSTIPGLQILFLDDLHAKVAVSETSAIVGSANISANGLGFEGSECAGWQEAGMLVNDGVHISELQQWFEQLWARGQEITEEHLAAAEEQWAKKRRCRPINVAGFSDATLAALRDHNLYVVIHREPASAQAEAEAAEVKAEAKKDVHLLGVKGIDPGKLDFYEDWPDDSEEPLPKGNPFIAVYYGPRRGIRGDGLWIRTPQYDRVFDSVDTGEKIQLTMVQRAEDREDLNFLNENKKDLANWLKPWIHDLFVGTDTGFARCVKFNQFIDWKEKQSQN